MWVAILGEALMPDDPVTLGELGRRLSDLKLSVDNLAIRVVTRDVWLVEQTRITDWLARLEREHTQFEERVRADKEREEERRRARIEADQSQRIADRRLIYGALLAGAGGFIVNILTRLYGGA